MILFESRAAIERHGIQQLLNGMRGEFPRLVPGWLEMLERADQWDDLGQRMAQAIKTSAANPLLEFTTPTPSTFLPIPSQESLLRDFAEKYQRAEAELKRQRERADRTENEAMSLRWEMDEKEKRAAVQIAQLTAEVLDLQRIVGEQQFRLNQPTETTE